MVLLAVFAFTSAGSRPAAPTAGAFYASDWQRIFSRDFLPHLALPALTLALYLQGLPLLLMRWTMLEVMQRGFRHHGADEGLPGVAHHARATPRATRCCRS